MCMKTIFGNGWIPQDNKTNRPRTVNVYDRIFEWIKEMCRLPKLFRNVGVRHIAKWKCLQIQIN